MSGKLLVRMTKQLHQRLATEAEYEGTSLNQLIVTRLAGTMRNDLAICPVHQCLMVPSGMDWRCGTPECGWQRITCAEENA